jgi:hypothetical protein
MKPYSSSSEKENCSPLSSNCVVWQGPFIECINICKGDSVSDIVYKLSEKVCNIEGGTTINDVNVTCLLESCDFLEAPDGTLGSLLQTIVDGICCSVGTLTEETATLTARTSNLYNEPSLVLPTNFQYVDPSTGLPVVTLPLNEFASNTATNSSTLKTIVQGQTIQISNQEIRIQTLESDPGYIPPTVTPLGTYGGVISGIPTQMNILLTAVENDYTLYKFSAGSTTDIINATNAQCPFLGSSEALGQPGVMSSITGWNNSLGNLAQSVQNLWLTVCDMRTAVNTIKQNITPDCSQFLLNYVVSTDTPREELTISYNGLTVIPAGFSNCPTLSTVSVTDGVTTFTDSLDLTADVTAGTTVIDLSTSGLNVNLPWVVTVTGCIVNSGVTCSKTVSKTDTPTTTTTTSASAVLYSIYIDQDDIDKATGNTTVTYYNDRVFVSYTDNTGAPALHVTTTTQETFSICVYPGVVPVIYYFAGNNIQATEDSIMTIIGVCP